MAEKILTDFLDSNWLEDESLRCCTGLDENKF